MIKVSFLIIGGSFILVYFTYITIHILTLIGGT
jgi:hypothetical protein